MSEPWDWGGDRVLPQRDRLRILSPDEYDLLWGQPRFSDTDRAFYFDLNPKEEALVGRLRTIRTKAHFLLQLGYFRACQRFFPLDMDLVADDLAYVCQRYLGGVTAPDLAVSKHTRQQHVQWILDRFGFQPMDTQARGAVEARVLSAARISSRPLYVLRDLVDHLRRQRIVLPGYTYLQDVVRRALAFERHRLSDALSEAMTPTDVELLDHLLADDDGLHSVTELKHPLRDFSHQQLLAEIERGERIRPLFAVAQRTVEQAELSVESVRFYASLVEYYTVYKLKRMTSAMSRLYLLCFVHDRYQRLNDHLLSAFCALVRRYTDEVAAATKDALYQHRHQASSDLEQGVKILQLFLDPTVADETPFADVRTRALALLPPDRLVQLCGHLAQDRVLDELAYEWTAVDEIMAKVKRNLRPVIRFVRFAGTPSQHAVLDALERLADAFRNGRHVPTSVPTALIPERHQRYLMRADGTLVRDRYEFLIYRQLRDRLEAGDLFCPEVPGIGASRMISSARILWQTKTRCCPKWVWSKRRRRSSSNWPCFVTPSPRALTRSTAASRRATTGSFGSSTARPSGRAQDAAEPAEHEPLFDAVERIDIDQLLLHVDRQTDFLAAFEHVMGRYQRTRESKPVTIAALMAFATNMGLGRMAEISNLSHGQLSTTAANFIRLETLREANDRLANATAQLPIFRYFDIGETVHSSSDGQKFETAISTVNARHSAKYFGLKD